MPRHTPCSRVRLLFFALACCLITSPDTSLAGENSAFTISVTVPGDLFLYDQRELDALIERLKTSNVNTVAIPIAWRVVEAQPSQFDFSAYAPKLDQLVDAGFTLLPIIDNSARILLHASGAETSLPATPDWLIGNHKNSFAADVAGTRHFNLDYYDKKHLVFLKRFYQQSLLFLNQRYGEKISAVAPGISHELEIKFPQFSYRWQSYSENAQRVFDSWLIDAGKAPAPLPEMQYGNNLANHVPREEPLFADLMRFREAALTSYVCRLTRWIHSQGFTAAGYFDQPLSSHDAIYASGVIERLVDCFDEIIVDYNFFDGWSVRRLPALPAMLVNYALNLGYEKVSAGLYFGFLSDICG